MKPEYKPTEYIKAKLRLQFKYNRSANKATYRGLKGIYNAIWNDDGTITYSFREYPTIPYIEYNL